MPRIVGLTILDSKDIHILAKAVPASGTIIAVTPSITQAAPGESFTIKMDVKINSAGVYWTSIYQYADPSTGLDWKQIGIELPVGYYGGIAGPGNYSTNHIVTMPSIPAGSYWKLKCQLVIL